MKQYWLVVSTKVDAMSLRERAMVFLIAVLLLFFILNTLLFAPLQAKQKAVSEKRAQQEQELITVEASIVAIRQARLANEHSPVRERILGLTAQLKASEALRQSRLARMVEPEKMTTLLGQVLRGNDKLELVELKTLPLAPIAENTAEAKTPLIYKHGVQITVRGGYLELLRYLAALEKLPVQMFWGGLTLSVEKYPDAVMTLTVYTLSLDKTWLTI